MLCSDEGYKMRNIMIALIVAFAKNQVIGNKVLYIKAIMENKNFA